MATHQTGEREYPVESTPQRRTRELGEQAQAEFARQEVLVQEAAVAAVAHFTDAEMALRIVAVLKRQRLLAGRID